jgi:hypothetical protein
MPLPFRGAALPLDEQGMAAVTDGLGVAAADVWAVLTVETRGCGFLPDRRPAILFERHVFSRETGHKFDSTHSEISSREGGGYGDGGAHQYDRLQQAADLDRRAALRSTSWGIGQLMGFNAEIAGYADVEAMVTDMAVSENNQLLGMSKEIGHNGLDRALRSHDWTSFARGYNGPAYAKNRYDTRLAAAYQKVALGLLPDLTVRAAQIYLTCLGYRPGPVDGVLGRFTRSALNDFQVTHGLAASDDVDGTVLAGLAREFGSLPA